MSALFTVKMLTDGGACSEQVDLFRETFGSCVNVTVARARKVAEKFDWDFAARFLDKEGRAEYERVRSELCAKYEPVRDAAWAEYLSVRGAAWDEYLSGGSAARAEHLRVSNVAMAEYLRVRDAVCAKYGPVSGPTWASAYIATCKRREAAIVAAPLSATSPAMVQPAVRIGKNGVHEA